MPSAARPSSAGWWFGGRRLPAIGSIAGAVLLLVTTACHSPIGADRASPRRVYTQVNGNVIVTRDISQRTQAILHRFDQAEQFRKSPDAVLRLLHRKAVETGERDLLFALAELNSMAGERSRRSLKPWEPKDPRDYYLSAAVYSWLFLFDGPADTLPTPFDVRFRSACDIYNYALGRALTERRSTNGLVMLREGTWRPASGPIQINFNPAGFPWPLTNFSSFVLADQFVVRGLSIRNRHPGLGTPLIAISKSRNKSNITTTTPATVLLRLHGGLAELNRNQASATLELYSAYGQDTFNWQDRAIPLETDTTVPIAYSLNQSLVWKLGKLQFLSGIEQIPSGVYQTRPYEPGRVPVVFVHGTFSSPVWWAEMFNTLSADPVLGKNCQFWYFIYNSGNPIVYSASRLREALTAKVKELDPDGKDAALQQMVVVGHSQGGLLTKLTATDTGDRLWHVVNTNRMEDVVTDPAQQELIRQLIFYDALPCVKQTVFISTPHRGSYLATKLVRNLMRRLVSLPRQVVSQSQQLAGLKERLNLPTELRGTPTSLDHMSPRNPFLLTLADIPTAPGVKAHSIIAVRNSAKYQQSNDGVVSYQSAHVDYVESEFIVQSQHSCQQQPATIEEVRRILQEHLASLPASRDSPASPPAVSDHP